MTLPRLDGHYDWLPSPDTTFKNQSLPAKVLGDGCTADDRAKGVIAIVSEKNCDYFVKAGISFVPSTIHLSPIIIIIIVIIIFVRLTSPSFARRRCL